MSSYQFLNPPEWFNIPAILWISMLLIINFIFSEIKRGIFEIVCFMIWEESKIISKDQAQSVGDVCLCFYLMNDNIFEFEKYLYFRKPRELENAISMTNLMLPKYNTQFNSLYYPDVDSVMDRLSYIPNNSIVEVPPEYFEIVKSKNRNIEYRKGVVSYLNAKLLDKYGLLKELDGGQLVSCIDTSISFLFIYLRTRLENTHENAIIAATAISQYQPVMLKSFSFLNNSWSKLVKNESLFKLFKLELVALSIVVPMVFNISHAKNDNLSKYQFIARSTSLVAGSATGVIGGIAGSLASPLAGTIVGITTGLLVEKSCRKLFNLAQGDLNVPLLFSIVIKYYATLHSLSYDELNALTSKLDFDLIAAELKSSRKLASSCNVNLHYWGFVTLVLHMQPVVDDLVDRRVILVEPATKKLKSGEFKRLLKIFQ